MTQDTKPSLKPLNPSFSSGPCAKPPGWSPHWLDGAFLGRSHRSVAGVERLHLAIERTRGLLNLPSHVRIAIVPGSDTGAFEACLWSLLGARGVTLLAWESFGRLWVRDVLSELRLDRTRVIEAEFGRLPDLLAVDFDDDVVFTANGTTSGVAIPNYDWVPEGRRGLTIVDGTSALFSQPVDWRKVDAFTFSWQKGLGGEAAHGMLILGERAAERLETHVPRWPVPKLFRLTENGRINEALFKGLTINTPSMLAVEDYLATLAWAQRIGGLEGLHRRAAANAGVLFDWIEQSPWVKNAALDATTRSTSSVCLAFKDPVVAALDDGARTAFVQNMVGRLAEEGAAFDIAGYRDAPPGLRIWTGPTIEAEDLKRLTPWLDWAFSTCRKDLQD